MRLSTLFYLAEVSVLASALAVDLRVPWSSQEWDVIIVGAGTAGIVVADRLSEAGKKTLLLEVGGPSYGITGGRERPGWLNGTDISRVDVPGLYSSIFAGSESLLCPPEVISGAFQACTIGGQSAINAGLYFQPPASDWDTYFPSGWKNADVKAATNRLLHRLPSETVTSKDKKLYLQSGYEAVKGWIVGSLGYSDVSINDVSSDKTRVFGRPTYNYIGGQRGGPVRTYLQTALTRANFHLESGVRVKWINRKKGVASGVEVDIGGKSKCIHLAPRGRVVLSGGALASPQLLMLSGIGPVEALTNLSKASHTPYDSSSWIVNPSVGVGLYDNPNTFIEMSSPDIKSYRYSYDKPIAADKDLYLSSRSGPYASAGQTSAFWSYVTHKDGSKTGMQGTVSSSGTFKNVDHPNVITMNVYGTSGLLSSGHVKLSTDGNFSAMPAGNLYYGNPRDAKDIAQFIHSIFQGLPHSTPKSPAAKGLTPLNLSQNSTLEEIHKYITTPSDYAVGAVQHWTSSCKIGSCVDKNTQVIGTKNIHVIDASITEAFTVNPHFGVMVAAEKGAELILALSR